MTGRDTRAKAALAVRRTRPGYFASVMATGIVAAAVRQAGGPGLSAVLLVIAAAMFIILAVAMAWRAAAFPGDLRGDLTGMGHAFTCFAFVAACNVLGDDLATDGQHAAATALAAASVVAWLGLTWLIPGRLAARPRDRPPITDVSGNWYLWAVATLSLAIAAAFLHSGATPQQRLGEVAAWSAGVAIYVVTSGLVAARLLRAGLGQQDDTAPYWVAMGAASLAVLGAAGILSLRAPAALAMGRPVITGIAVALWILATGLIPVLLGRAAWRHLRWRVPLRYRADLWVVVFPAGMYATAGIQFGTAAALPVVRDVGLAAAWAAAGAWTVTFAAMIISPLRRSRLPAAPLA